MKDVARQISVTGTGSAAAPPDVAIVTVGVEVMARSVAAARTQAAADGTAVIEALRSGGVSERDMTTTTFSVHPENDHRGGRHLRGYRVINSVEARVRDLDSLGHLLDSVVVAGGGNAVITDIRLVHEDTTALDIAARTKAWQDARRKATQLAELAGLVLGDPAFINEQSQLSPMPPVRHAMLESAAATPIEAGEMSVTVSLTVGFALVSQGEKGTAKKETAQKAAKKKSAQKKSGEKKAAKKK
jgi:hypothetical protein